MKKYIIQGGRPLKGSIKVGGSKNSAMPVLSAALLINGKTILSNVPKLSDITTFMELIRRLGATAKEIESNTWEIDASNIHTGAVNDTGLEKIRGSQTLLGALLARKKTVTLPSLGGCQIGARPIDIHLNGFHQLGAVSSSIKGAVHLETEALLGSHIYLDYPSFGATANLIIASCQAKGNTVIENAAQEPEIADLVNFLNKAGAKIYGIGSKTLRISGVDSLKPIKHRIMPDRIQACTYMIAAAITRGDLQIENISVNDFSSVVFKLRETGADIQIINTDKIRIKMTKRPLGFKIKTMPFPGFPTDVQSNMLALASVAEGMSVIMESVFENRFQVAAELNRMGAKIVYNERMATVSGVERLSGAIVEASNLRAGSSLVLAALSAENESEVLGIETIDRGYESLDANLAECGAQIKRLEEKSDHY
jgi:UDP-N-acetylglucosamine 1-carboxyvinyltransferase